MSKVKVYELGVPVCEVWIFRVKARSSEEAWNLFNKHDSSVEQIGSVAGTQEYCHEIVDLKITDAHHKHDRAKQMLKTKRRFTDMSTPKKPLEKAESIVNKLRKKGLSDAQIREHVKKSKDGMTAVEKRNSIKNIKSK